MNMIEEMKIINEYELHKKVVLIKIYELCCKIVNSRLSIEQKKNFS